MDANVQAHSFLKRISAPDIGKIYPLCSRKSNFGSAYKFGVITDAFLSREHCSIIYDNSSWIITDHGGMKGTYLNGKKMESRSWCGLKDRTTIFFGDPKESTYGFIFLTSPPESAPMELGDTSDLQPDQSDDTQGVIGSDEITERNPRPCHIYCQPDYTFKDRLESIRQVARRVYPTTSNQLIALLNDSALTEETSGCDDRILYDLCYMEIVSSILKRVVSRADGPKQSRGSASADESRTCLFEVLDFLLTNRNSDGSDSDSSISSVDSRETRKRKAFHSDGENQSHKKEKKHSSPSDEDQRRESRLRESLESEDDSPNLKKPESLHPIKKRDPKLKRLVLHITRELNDEIERGNELAAIIQEQSTIIKELKKKPEIIREQVVQDLEAELSCNICFEVLVKPVILNCGHIFCYYCIRMWKENKSQCPNCRSAINTEEEVKILDSYIDKAINRLEPKYRKNRNELAESRKTDLEDYIRSSRRRYPYHEIFAVLNAEGVRYMSY